MKNPWLSLWLSAANSWAGPVRGFWLAEMQRQQTAAMNVMAKEMARLWTGGWMVPPKARSRRHGKVQS